MMVPTMKGVFLGISWACIVIAIVYVRPVDTVIAGEIDMNVFRENLELISTTSSGVLFFQGFLNSEVLFTRTPVDGNLKVAQNHALSVTEAIAAHLSSLVLRLQCCGGVGPEKDVLMWNPWRMKYIGGKLASRLTSKIQERFTLVRNLKQTIESEFGSFTTTSSYKECCKVKLSEEYYSNALRSEVDLENMCYRLSPNSNNEFKHATSGVLQTFKENLQAVPDVIYQYFGGADGVFALYPSGGVSKCNSYDPRFRPWYFMTASGVKDVVIVLDSSAGMTAEKLGKYTLHKAAKAAIGYILDTLNPKDRVGVVSFSNEASVPEGLSHSCYETSLAYANAPNKEELKEYVDGLAAAGPSKYSVGLAKAFELLQQSYISSRRTVILFLSGVAPSDSLDEIKAAIRTGNTNAIFDNRISVLSFGVGSRLPPASDSALRAIITEAQTNAGIFTSLPNSKTLKNDLISYINYFASNDFDDPIVTPPYLDALGLGVVTTVTLPVFHSGQLVGVIGADVTIDDLFGDIISMNPNAGYGFVYDRIDHFALAHPLLPKPETVNSNPIMLFIENLEKGNGTIGLLNETDNEEYGISNFTAPRYYPNGYAYREGVTVEWVNMFYYYRRVQGTSFVACFVTIEGSEEISGRLETQRNPDDSLKFVYHRLDLQPELVNCRRYYRVSSQDQSSVKFAPNSFLAMNRYLDHEETMEDIAIYRGVVERREDNDLFQPGVIDDAYITTLMDAEWRQGGSFETSRVTYAVWRYIGTESGVIRIFPAVQVSKGYDPRERAWYKRAKASPGSYTISSPYLDAFGAGFIISVAETVHVTGSPDVFGVIATDITIHYMYHLMTSEYFDCEQAESLCFIMDKTGYIVVHKTWIHGVWTQTPNVTNVHVTALEPYIAKHMIDHGYFLRQQCTNVFNIRTHTYFQASETFTRADHREDPNAWYLAERVPNSNLYIVVKQINHDFTEEHSCTCGDESIISPPPCVEGGNLTCQCPCFVTANFNPCTNLYSGIWLPCPPPNDIDVSEGKGDVHREFDQLAGLPWCDYQQCGRKRNRGECDEISMCRWCDRDRKGQEITAYCGEYDECYFGQVGHPSPYEVAKERSSGGAIVGGVVGAVAAVGVAVGGIVAFKAFAAGGAAAAAGSGAAGVGGAAGGGLVAGA